MSLRLFPLVGSAVRPVPVVRTMTVPPYSAPVHHAVCALCGTKWPCSTETQERQVQAFVAELSRLCRECGKPIKPGAYLTIFGGPDLDYPDVMGAHFHTGGRYPRCQRASDAYRARWTKRRDGLGR